MRWVFAMLVVINLALAGWLYWQQLMRHPQVNAPQATVVKGQGLLLLSELSSGELKPIKEKPGAVLPTTKPQETPANNETTQNASSENEKQPEPQPTRCLRISGLATKKMLNGLSAKITARHFVVHDRGEAFEEEEVYWVYIPSLKNRADANSVIKQLVRKRVKDYLLVRSGEFENAVSLGIFSQRDGAEKRLKGIKALHLRTPSPQILPKTSTVRRYWLMVEERNKEEREKLSSLLKSQGHTGKSVECTR